MDKYINKNKISLFSADELEQSIHIIQTPSIEIKIEIKNI